jgi:hypothetical protein
VEPPGRQGKGVGGEPKEIRRGIEGKPEVNGNNTLPTQDPHSTHMGKMKKEEGRRKKTEEGESGG